MSEYLCTLCKDRGIILGQGWEFCSCDAGLALRREAHVNAMFDDIDEGMKDTDGQMRLPMWEGKDDL